MRESPPPLLVREDASLDEVHPVLLRVPKESHLSSAIGDWNAPISSRFCFEASDSEKRDMHNNKDFHGAEITTAYVEIVFNNEDDRFQTGTHSGEIVLAFLLF